MACSPISKALTFIVWYSLSTHCGEPAKSAAHGRAAQRRADLSPNSNCSDKVTFLRRHDEGGMRSLQSLPLACCCQLGDLAPSMMNITLLAPIDEAESCRLNQTSSLLCAVMLGAGKTCSHRSIQTEITATAFHSWTEKSAHFDAKAEGSWTSLTARSLSPCSCALQPTVMRRHCSGVPGLTHAIRLDVALEQQSWSARSHSVVRRDEGVDEAACRAYAHRGFQHHEVSDAACSAQISRPSRLCKHFR